MAGVRDIVQLKLQKRLLQEKMSLTDTKIDRLSDIMKKKTMKTGMHEPYEKTTFTRTGVPVGDLKLARRSIKAVPIDNHYNPYETEATPVNNKNIIRIRQEHCIRTTGKSEVQKKIKEKHDREKKKQPKTRALPRIPIPESMLPNRYVRGELPCTIEHGVSGKYLSWACPLENLDYEYYLPLFFDGLQCSDHIISFIAKQGIEDMLYAARGHPGRIIPLLPMLVRPLRNALSKFETSVLLGVLKALQQLITCNDGVGEALLPFGKQFLAPISFFMHENKNLGDGIDYGQRKNDDVGEEIRKVLELMEEFGGPKALQAIKFSIPLYESCMKRPDAHHMKDTR